MEPDPNNPLSWGFASHHINDYPYFGPDQHAHSDLYIHSHSHPSAHCNPYGPGHSRTCSLSSPFEELVEHGVDGDGGLCGSYN